MSRKFLWAFLVLVMAAVIGAALFRRGNPSTDSSRLEIQTEPARTGEVPRFRLVDQAGRPLDSQSLRGRVWVADFIFTSCGGACPEMSRKMSLLQKKLPGEVQLVSVSVDPVRDSPPVLAAYAAQYGADPNRWHFLTGSPEAVQTLVQKGFRLSVAEGGSPEEPITHSQRFVLVDQEGRIRGYYDSNEPEKLDQLVRNASSLSRSGFDKLSPNGAVQGEPVEP